MVSTPSPHLHPPPPSEPHLDMPDDRLTPKILCCSNQLHKLASHAWFPFTDVSQRSQENNNLLPTLDDLKKIYFSFRCLSQQSPENDRNQIFVNSCTKLTLLCFRDLILQFFCILLLYFLLPSFKKNNLVFVLLTLFFSIRSKINGQNWIGYAALLDNPPIHPRQSVR